MKTLKRIFELMCSGTVVAAEHLCQCAKCSCNFDKTKAKQSDAGCSCPNCGTLLDEKGAAKVEDQAAKEIKADGDEIQAHKGVIEACGGMAARGNGAAGLEASNPEGINQYTGKGGDSVREKILHPGLGTDQEAREGGWHTTGQTTRTIHTPAGSYDASVAGEGGTDVRVKHFPNREEWAKGVYGGKHTTLGVFKSGPEARKAIAEHLGSGRGEYKTGEEMFRPVAASDATRQPALEAGGPGSGPQGGKTDYAAKMAEHDTARHSADTKTPEAFKAHTDSMAAYSASEKAEESGKVEDHAKAGYLHALANRDHAANGNQKHADEHSLESMKHFGKAAGVNAANSAGKDGLQAGFNGNQHKSAKELAAEHSVAADTASKVAASASKAARNQDPSNKEGLHDSAMTMHTAAKSLHELAAQKHRSAGNEDCAKDHDTAAAGHGDEIQAHKGVIEACGGVAARGNGAAGLEAGGPGSGRYPAGSGKQHTLETHQEKDQDGRTSSVKLFHVEDNRYVHPNGTFYQKNHFDKTVHQEQTHEAPDTETRIRHNKIVESILPKKPASSGEKNKELQDMFGSNATPAAGLQLDCSACVEAKAAKSILNPIADGIIQYMPSGTHTITPSQNGRPVTVSVAVDASAADKLEQQRRSLEASGKKPFFSVQHSTQIAAFWPAEFFWDTRLDATGSLVEGVWARGEWTRAGREAVEGKDFRTFSPTFFVDAIRNDPNRPVQVVCNDEAKANMGALENDPAFQTISPLWCSNAGSISKENRGVIVACHNAIRHLDPDIAELQRELKSRHGLDCSETEIAFALV